MTSLFALIERHASDDVDVTTSAVEKDLKLTASQRDALHALIANEVRRLWRARVRPLEPRTGAPSTNPAESRSEYLKARFSLPDGRHPTWGDATVADHLLRIAMLAKLRDGLDLTIQVHEDAVTRITEAGVSCLNELPAEVAA